MTGLLPSFRDIFQDLFARFGPQGWWPAESTFEMMVGAILVQNTAWNNVEISIRQLRARELLDPQTILHTKPEELVDAVRPSGFMRAKSQSCVALARWTVACDVLNGGVEKINDLYLREDLLTLRGIGPETADVIMLYAFNRPTFIWDLYARRMLGSFGYRVPRSYEATRRQLSEKVKRAEFSTAELAEFHALIVEAKLR